MIRALSRSLRIVRATAAPPTTVVRPAVGTPTHGRGVGVAVHDFHVVHVNADFVGDDLGEGGLLALAVRRGADKHVHLAGGVDAHGGAFPQPTAETDGSGHL